MPFIAAKCPACGGDIQLNDVKESGFCLYCGSKVLLSEAIPQNVRVEGIHTLENKLNNAETFAKLGEVSKAIALLTQITEEFTSDYRAWWMLAKLRKAHPFFYMNADPGYINEIEGSKEFLYAYRLVSETSRKQIDNEYNMYKRAINYKIVESQKKIDAIRAGDFSLLNHAIAYTAGGMPISGYEVIDGVLKHWKMSNENSFYSMKLNTVNIQNLGILHITQDYLMISNLSVQEKYKMQKVTSVYLANYFNWYREEEIKRKKIADYEEMLKKDLAEKAKRNRRIMITLGVIGGIIQIVLYLFYFYESASK